MNKKVLLWVILGVVVVGGLAGASIANNSRGKVEAVQMARVRREDVTSQVRAPGKIEPRTQVKVSADIMGKIVHLYVKEGDRVKKDQLMLQLDDTQYRSAHAQAKAALAAAQARLREAQSALRMNDSNFGRQRQLYEQKLLSTAEWEQAQNAHEGARVAVATAQEDAARASAGLDAAADNLRKCRFLAPFDGVVSALNVEAGENVIPGTMNNIGTEILVVSDLSRMLVRADVDETDVVDMRLAQKTKIAVDAFPDTTFPGTVSEIGNTAKRSITSTVDGQTNFEVKVVFDQNVPEVRPGMTADVEIETGTHPHTLVVPIQSVVVRTERELERAKKGVKGAKMDRRAKRAAAAAEEDTVGRRDKEITGVFVVRNDVATFVPVRTGLASETMIEVFGDVKEGDSVVSGPYKALRELKPGGKVKKETAAKGKK
ncbi:MAG: efflux RND transporter periplasmic adaptor subunit [Candidatus Eisenbacteria bacterium]|uniref:Efflux RND transporter periplasmic adaptor subunit n=1 Tax=Eiseniibacteriota bacterium TaxID=2212470 RepID=A0A933SCN5_UNCEI|nr:efflux RND transporter periplasmic adaptor subunit [Candidatus Eisenbacteria bacterium]